MNYRHYLTFRYEGRIDGANGWVWVDGNSVDAILNDTAIVEAIASIRETGAKRMGCLSDEVLVFLVNHTVTTL